MTYDEYCNVLEDIHNNYHDGLISEKEVYLQIDALQNTWQEEGEE